MIGFKEYCKLMKDETMAKNSAEKVINFSQSKLRARRLKTVESIGSDFPVQPQGTSLQK